LVQPAALVRKGIKADQSVWCGVKPEDYGKDMSFIAELNICNTAIDADRDFLGVFVEDECRGVVAPQYIEQLDAYYFFLPARSNTNGETLHFSYYNAGVDQTFEVNETALFGADQIMGEVDDPYLMSLTEHALCEVTGQSGHIVSGVKAFPNPFDEVVSVQLVNGNEGLLEIDIFDVSGVSIRSIRTTDASLQWDGKNNAGREVPDGVYLMTLSSEQQVRHIKVMKAKD
jgi:hypothetical protein